MSTKIYKLNLEKLVSFIERNHVAVPEFQRGYVWKIPQVKQLFDSLTKKYPIGSFILWKTKQRIDARTFDGSRLGSTKFLVLDAQQRLLSLYYLSRQKIFSQHDVRDRFHDICENRYSQLIDFDKFYISRSPNGHALEYDKRVANKEIKFRKLVNLVGRHYMVPVVIISLDNYKHAIEIFERINQAGTRISTESIFLSETWSTHTDFEKILRKWKRANPDALTREVARVSFIHVFSLIWQLQEKGKKKSSFSIDIKELKRIAQEIRNAKNASRVNTIFERCIGAVSKAVQYLKEEYGIVSLSELPSQTAIAVLAVFFYYNNKATLGQQKELRRWFWRSSLSNRYIGSGYNKNIGPDAADMRRLALEGKPLGLGKVDVGRAYFDATDIKAGRSSVRNIVKLAIWKQAPKHIDGSLVNREDVETRQHKPEDDHFYPYHLYRQALLGAEVNNILNIHFLNKNENVRKGKEAPSQWMEAEITFYGNINQKQLKNYFESQLLPFSSKKIFITFDRPFRRRKDRRMKKKMRSRYQRFLQKRFYALRKSLHALQDGRQ